MKTLPKYVLITPARNEARFIELTLKSVVAQTVPPLKWVIVSDGSTDGTDDIVRKYMADYPWIELLALPDRKHRDFAGKVYAFNAGYEKAQGLGYEVVASLDADISFDSDYFSFLLGKLTEDATLGLVGTPFRDDSGEMYDYRYVSIEHVSGACQVFRRECFEDIGGYKPVKGGLIDHIAVISTRMKGWKTRTFTDKICLHHREIGTAQCTPTQAAYDCGVKDFKMGGHPVWEMFRCVYQMTKKPLVIRGLALGAGYVVATVRRPQRPVTPELVAFHRREQVERLKKFFAQKVASVKNLIFPAGRAHRQQSVSCENRLER